MICSVCSTPSSLQCSRCLRAQYCSIACQKKDWKVHKEICKAPAEVVVEKKKYVALISNRADNIIYNRFRELLPNVNIENMEGENTDDEKKCWVQLMSVVKPFISGQPYRPTPYRINALFGFSDENASLICYAIAVIIEIARRKEISGYKPTKVV